MRQGPIDITGQAFGFLTVVRRAGSFRRKGIKKNALWLCRCSCGEEVVLKGTTLRLGRQKSCARNGHYWKPWTGRPNLVARYQTEYRSWRGAHDRCEDPKIRSYGNYGARGIKVCARWNEFATFLQDMGCKPSSKHSLDRIDTNGDYSPENCRWATASEQRRNSRNTVFVEYEGQRVKLADLVERLGLKAEVVYGRLKMGWSLADALTLPVRKRVLNGQGKPYQKKSKKPQTTTPWDLSS